VNDEAPRQPDAAGPTGAASPPGPREDAATQVAGPLPPGVPERIGGFRLRQALASGGMGTVYLAVQDQPRRTVALKIMKRGLLSESLMRRFEFESQILGRLRHPGIAQVFEAGTFEDRGERLPYFAMEYIPKARPISDYVHGRRLGTRDTFALFIRVCEAVHHGHQKGVIHRDLKPENILVDAEGNPKIIDFGVARTTGADIAAATLQTDVGQLVGTLQYMSPEQCEADPHDIDTRSDIYALGVVLYELLTHRLPYDVGRVAIYEATRLIREHTPPRPSTIDRALRGDAETIVMRAMEKDRDRRYQSAADLARDMERYLGNEPIEARRPSVIYNLRMFARRHRGLAAATIVVTCVLILATTVSIGYAVQASLAERRATAAGVVAMRERDAADAARLAAQDAKRESDRQRDAALAAEARAERQAYILHVAAAISSLEAGDVPTAKRHLERAPQRFRGWEWRRLSRVADASQAVIRGNDSWIQSVAVTADGSRVISGAVDGSIRIFSTLTGEPVGRAAGHHSPVYQVVCSPDSLRLASASADNTVKVWNLVTGAELATLRGHTGVVSCVAYDRTGARLVSGSSDGTVRVWDAFRAIELHAIALGDAAVDCLAVSPDGSLIAVAATDELVHLFDTETGRSGSTLAGHTGFVSAITFSPDGARLAGAAEDGTVRVWLLDGSQPALTLRGHAGLVTGVAFDPDGTRLASTGEDGTLRLWDPLSGRDIITLSGHEGIVTSVAYDAVGVTIATGAEDRTIRLWDAHEFFEVTRVDSAPRAGVRAIAVSPDGTRLATGHDDQRIDLRDSLSGEHLGALAAHTATIRALAFAPDGSFLASGADDATVRLWSAHTGKPLGTLGGHDRLVSSIAITPDSAAVISGSWDGRILSHAVGAGTSRQLAQFSASINGLALSPRGDRVVAGLSDGSVTLKGLDDDDRVVLLPEGDDSIRTVAWAPDGGSLAGGSANGMVRVWSAESLEELWSAPGHALAVTCVGFLPDGDRLVSASTDGALRVWERATGEALGTLRDGSDPIECLALSPDGTWCATGSLTGQVFLLDGGPARARYLDRSGLRLAQGSGASLFSSLLAQGAAPEEIIQRVRDDPRLGMLERRCALNCALRHCCAAGSR
jgi:WD40 repeat protein/tRNA A-37 threonylcarbamoyl transferase component Bud32